MPRTESMSRSHDEHAMGSGTATARAALGWSLWAAVVLLGAVVTRPVVGQEAPRALVVTAQNLMAGDQRHQDVAAAGGDQAALLPGDVVRYRLRFTNVTGGEVRGVVFTNPVPARLRYVERSATADRDDVVIDYSIDGGQTYAARPMVVEIVDGERVERPAPPEAYTHVRWTVRGAVSSGAMVTAEFRAELVPAPAPEGASNPEASTRR